MSSNDQSSGAFLTTRWTQVMQARGDSEAARAALSDLCAAYYAPVFKFIRHDSQRDEDATRDLTQEFFVRLLAKGGLDTLERGRGRFRSFLLGAVKHFLAHQRERECAAKRGGGEQPLSLDAGTGADTDTGLQVPDPSGPAPDALFDRQWAVTLVDRALQALAQESASEQKGEQFQVLKPWLLGEVEMLSQAEAATQLGMSEGAVKVAVHRLRKRFRELVKGEIAQTVDDTGEVQDELRYLLEVLTQA